MLFLEIILFIFLISLTIFIRIDYEKRGKKRLFGHFIHTFFNKDLYDEYDQYKENSSSLSE